MVGSLLDGAALGPVFQQHIRDGEQVAQFGVFQLSAEVGGTPVAPVGHFARHAVVDVQALRKFFCADAGNEQYCFHAKRGHYFQGQFSLPSDDD